jgi:hypothetical protein
VTDATVSNRVIRLQVTDGTTVLSTLSPNSLQAASLTRVYSNARHTQSLDASGNNLLINPLIDSIIGAGYKIRTNTINLQAGDNYGTPQMLVEEWIEP